MAGVTQTIPQYSAGISEQPDNLKFPGQVVESINAIPDVTKGLFKRPGAARIGANALANVQSGGAYFHYYRDDKEGAYIGQVASDGQLRMWKADGDNAGAPQTIVYGTGGQTTIQNYLQTTDPENLQFLTINDTTFVSNRDASDYTQAEIDAGVAPSGTTAGDKRTITAVGHTGTTDATPDAHFAFIELLRTENGRQYGLNLSDSSTPQTLNRATRIRIESDTLDESDGTGHCPGIGTQVFTVDSGSKKNLIFRINALGQQGVSPDYDASSNGPDGDNYRCSYNREVVLLHGGEGWVTNDTVTVSLTSASGGGPMRQRWNGSASYSANDEVRNAGNSYRAKTNLTNANTEPTHTATADDTSEWEFISDDDSPAATYVIKVIDHEEVSVQATMNSTNAGLIRPAPTPFDADTAVTADTILGGIKDALTGTGVSATIIGTGMYLSSTSAFNVEVVEEDLMRVMQSSVNDVTRLPNQCKNGYIVKVSNSRMADEDDYYVRFDGNNNRDGSGSWSECAEPGIPKTLTNMPLVIQRTALANPNSATEVATFTIRQFTYADRRVGDENTNPLPSFVKTSDGQPKSGSNTFEGRINKVLFFRNRLVFLSGENVVTSRPGSLGQPDFFSETALTIASSDPIDISAASMFPSELFDGIAINTGLVVFSTNQQFLLASDDTVLNPDTAKLRSISTFNYNRDIAPISLGTTIGYVDNSGKFSRFNEMANIAREGEPVVVEVSKIVPTILPKDIDLLTNSRENGIILFAKSSSTDCIIYGYKYMNVAEKRQQAAWFKWKMNNPIPVSYTHLTLPTSDLV